MADLITLNCPTCGGNLQVTNDVERFVCAHCGNAHIVDPGVRVESLVGEVSTFRAEYSIRRLQQEIEKLTEKRTRLNDEVVVYRQLVFIAWLLFRGSGVFASWLALNSINRLIQDLANQRYATILVTLGAIVFFLFAALRLIRQKRLPFVSTLDAIRDGIRNVDQRIARLRRAVEQEEQRFRRLDVNERPDTQRKRPFIGAESLST